MRAVIGVLAAVGLGLGLGGCFGSIGEPAHRRSPEPGPRDAGTTLDGGSPGGQGTPDGGPRPPDAGDGGGEVTPTCEDAARNQGELGVDCGGPCPPCAVAEDVRLRILIETDAPGGDPDDEGSLVRWFLYVNEWDVEGILATRRADQSRTGLDGEETLLDFVDDYAAVYPSLRAHDPRYPAPDALRAKVAASFRGTAARDLVIGAVDADDPRPIWYANFGTNDGNLTGMRQALDHVRRVRSAAEYAEFIGKIYVSRDAARTYHLEASTDPDDPSNHVPHLPFWVDTRDPDRWYHRFEPLTRDAGGFDAERDIRRDHGPLAARYTIQKEGDSFAFLYLIPNGLNDPLHPDWGSWAGRFSPRSDARAAHNPTGFFWSDARDTWGGTTNRDNTLARWAVHLQNDFKARLDWCVTEPRGANHPPRPVLNGAAGLAPVHLRARAGATVALTAVGSSDPDGDALDLTWLLYREPGTVEGEVLLSAATGGRTEVTLPSSARAGETLHVLLVATDDGAPALTRYRRAVITVE